MGDPAIRASSRSAFVVSVKLANSTDREFKDCNTNTTISTVVKKPLDTISFKSVAEFGRELLSDTAPAWLLLIIRRHTVQKRSRAPFVISFGGGYDLLVLLEGADMPKDVSRVPRTTVSLSVTSKKEEAARGSTSLDLTNHNDSIWDHVDAVASAASDAHGVVIVLSDNRAPYGAFERLQERLEVIRLWTQPKSLFQVARIERPQGLIAATATAVSLQKNGEDSGDDPAAHGAERSKATETVPTDATANTNRVKKTTSVGGKEKGTAPATASPKRQMKAAQKKQATPKRSLTQKEGFDDTTEPGTSALTAEKKPGRPKGSKSKPKERPAEETTEDVEAKAKSPLAKKRDRQLATPPRKESVGSKGSTDKKAAASDSEPSGDDEASPEKNTKATKVTVKKTPKKKPTADDAEATEGKESLKKKTAPAKVTKSKKLSQEMEAKDEDKPKKRGRPKGSKNKPKGESATKKAKM